MARCPRNDGVSSSGAGRGLAAFLGLWTLALLAGGCSAPFYGKKADKDVYRIIDQVEANLFGRDKDFTIDTEYSARDSSGVSPQEIIDDRARAARMTLTIDKALEIAVESSRQYQSEKEQLYLTALSLTGERHEFSPQFFAGSTVTGTSFYDAATGKREKEGSVSSGIGVGQALKTGASIGVNIANDLLRFYTGDPRRSAISAISVNLSQPLLRGAGKSVVAEQLTQAEFDVIYAVRDFDHFQNTFAADIVVRYFRLLQDMDTVENQYQNYISRKNTAEYVRARAVGEREKPLDASRAEQDELVAKNSYINAVVRYLNSVDTFKNTLGLPQTIKLQLDQKEMEELEKAGPLPLYLEANSGMQIALDHFYPLMNEIDRFEDSKRKIKVAANLLKPGLDLFADGSLDSEGETNFEEFDFGKARASAGIALELPIDRLRERNQYRATLVSFESQLRTLGQALDDTKADLAEGIRRLDQFRLNYEIARSSITLAEQRVAGARLELEAGTALLRDLEEAQDDLINAQNAVTAALVDYLEARLRLLLSMGILESQQDEFWLRTDASSVDLGRATPTGKTGLQGDEVLPPDRIFSN